MPMAKTTVPPHSNEDAGDVLLCALAECSYVCEILVPVGRECVPGSQMCGVIFLVFLLFSSAASLSLRARVNTRAQGASLLPNVFTVFVYVCNPLCVCARVLR